VDGPGRARPWALLTFWHTVAILPTGFLSPFLGRMTAEKSSYVVDFTGKPGWFQALRCERGPTHARVGPRKHLAVCCGWPPHHTCARTSFLLAWPKIRYFCDGHHRSRS
jgi:hypothetical protein